MWFLVPFSDRSFAEQGTYEFALSADGEFLARTTIAVLQGD
jgi:hypothetical protein